ncbi:Holliday junction ATP-dependent DNA helicase RuvB [Candidatus Cyrtobacter comes]|uniref:Holliday junction branch migration complex subunit RuvB n=1 Tax=Candidatus Cyrtobacter comes TaxID=675776 RepID=A0ABU5L7U6_9RICK|nr:Holliday junction branch migration DNA helicase RuvB [Candidatus Cyrtobacter comes]MDZ5762195.1 Holliday junction ATP-dependent DNA helicase RuvB [Candidatus Cyrtobacter comes]
MQRLNSEISTELKEVDKIVARDFRPRSLDSFIGQVSMKQNLKVFIEAAKARNETLDHILFYGPPGLGKTTLAQIIAHEMCSEIKVTSAPMLSKVGDLAAILTNLCNNDILFIDEIHRLNSSVEETLYSAMEDRNIDIIIGEGQAARTVKITLNPFTLVGATTRLGLLSSPLRDRFGIPVKLSFYTQEELKLIVERMANITGKEIDFDASYKIAMCARGTPRIAIRLFKRIRDFSEHYNGLNGKIDLAIVKSSLDALEIDDMGLDISDYLYLKYIMKSHNGGPVGIETISAALSEDRDAIEDFIEPYLMQIGFISRTPRGRIVTNKCLGYIENIGLL